MSQDERLQELLNAFVDTLNAFAEGRHSREVHAATVARLLAELRELRAAEPDHALDIPTSLIRLMA